MLSRLREFEHWKVCSSDGHDVGALEDSLFDDEQWTVRYLVVKTGGWLAGRSVLQSPIAVARVRSEAETFELQLRQDQIKSAPPADLARPVSRQWEATFAGYYGFPPYWVGPCVGRWSRSRRNASDKQRRRIHSARIGRGATSSQQSGSRWLSHTGARRRDWTCQRLHRE